MEMIDENLNYIVLSMVHEVLNYSRNVHRQSFPKLGRVVYM